MWWTYCGEVIMKNISRIGNQDLHPIFLEIVHSEKRKIAIGSGTEAINIDTH
jgi:hypothetical protein